MIHASDAIYQQAQDLLRGEPGPDDQRRSFELNRQAAASGHRGAVLAMGWYYLSGVGVACDLALAKQWYRKAAAQKEPRAMFSLGQIACREGVIDEALVWLQRASTAGHARSFYLLAKLYWRGHGVRQNVRMAELLLQQGAAQKDPACRRAVRLLGWQRRKR
jgi:TPR repeat protein